MGVVATPEALRMTRERGYDLVMVSMAATPPVCKMLDYGRHRYEQEKRLRDAKKKQHTVSIKEITLSYKIGEHDYQVRLRRLMEFLEDGHKVKLTVRMRGRESQHSSLAIQLLNRFKTDAEELGDIERAPIQEGQRIMMIVNPKKEKK